MLLRTLINHPPLVEATATVGAPPDSPVDAGDGNWGDGPDPDQRILDGIQQWMHGGGYKELGSDLIEAAGEPGPRTLLVVTPHGLSGLDTEFEGRGSLILTWVSTADDPVLEAAIRDRLVRSTIWKRLQIDSSQAWDYLDAGWFIDCCVRAAWACLPAAAKFYYFERQGVLLEWAKTDIAASYGWDGDKDLFIDAGSDYQSGARPRLSPDAVSVKVLDGISAEARQPSTERLELSASTSIQFTIRYDVLDDTGSGAWAAIPTELQEDILLGLLETIEVDVAPQVARQLQVTEHPSLHWEPDRAVFQIENPQDRFQRWAEIVKLGPQLDEILRTIPAASCAAIKLRFPVRAGIILYLRLTDIGLVEDLITFACQVGIGSK